MASEFDRKTSMRRITNPADSTQFVDVKIIDEIAFVDPKQNGQFIRFRFDNSRKSGRKVHAVTVTGTGDSSNTVSVERVDEFTIVDPKSNAQEATFRLTGNASEPPAHQKTHDLTIFSS